MGTTRTPARQPTTHPHPPATRTRTRPRRRSTTHRRRWPGWVLAGGIAVAAVVAVAFAGGSPPKTASGAAPPFELATTDSREVALADYRGRNVLLYFNEGVGCDVCFYQTAKLEADEAFTSVDVTLVPIVMNPTAQVAPELQRFGVRTPYLADPDGSVARAYDTLGTGHHADLPGHTFILVGPDGTIRWRGDYPGMWVEPAELASAVSDKLG